MQAKVKTRFRMGFKKLTDLTSSELSIELKKASLVISGHNSDEREAIIRLSTHLIDMGEDLFWRKEGRDELDGQTEPTGQDRQAGEELLHSGREVGRGLSESTLGKQKRIKFYYCLQ